MIEAGDSPQLGVIVPNVGALVRDPGIGAMATAAEGAGADSLWVSDHLVMVDAPPSRYPYSADGTMAWDLEAEYYESFTCCATMAAVTTRARVGIAALVLPQRSVLEVAKVATSLDGISGGRLSIGIGVGWNAPEMEALGHPFKERGARTDEMLEILRSAWTGRPRESTLASVAAGPGVVVSPRPVQTPGPPLLIGGMGKRALRRAADLGDGWLPLQRAHEWDAAGLAESLDALRALLDERGRAASDFKVALKLHAKPEDAAAVPGIVIEAAGLGVDEVMFDVPWADGIAGAVEAIATVRAAVDR